MKKLLLISCLNSIIFIGYSQEASVKEEYVAFPAYMFSEPDPVARPGNIYPYFRFDRYSSVPVEKKTKMIVLENTWIKVWIAPEIGGKVWGALDKKTNKYFIYYNNVIKFRDIAMRGAWTSGGIEFNFGIIGHAPTTATPVDYCIQNNPDGSASCFVGAIDLPSRTEWRVEVRLPKDKSWFEINSYWNNPTDLKSSLYHWQTAAANASNDLQFYYPGKAYIDHSGNAFNWPLMNDGRDISFYKNNNYNSSHSYHVLGEYADWFAGYYHDSDYGFGHWTRYPYKPGKKIWIWDLSRSGAIWEDLLTDTDKGNTQYIEMQTGLLFNQEGDESTMSPFKHLFFEPGAVENFKELWFPLSNTKGVSSISKEGILSIEKNVKGYNILFQSLTFITDRLQIVDTSGNILYDYGLQLEPEQIFEKSIDLETDDVIIKLADGELCYNLSDKETGLLDRPLTIMKDFDWGSVYGLYTQGIEKSKQRSYIEAAGYFQQCLTKDPSYLPALTSLAEIDVRQLKYDEAEKKLLHVISFDTYDPDANFLYGVLLTKKQEYNKARDAFGVTLRSQQYKSVSLNQLALIALKEKRLEEAWDYVSNAGLYNGIDKNIYRTASVISRLRGDHGTYDMLLQQLSAIDPLCHFADFEKYFSQRDSVTKSEFTSKITGELSFETYIELALWYYKAGLEDEAFAVMELCPENPLADYFTAFLAYRKKDTLKCDFYFERAISADDKFVFPFREEYADILYWADRKQTSWKTKYYSALLYWSRQQPQIADKFFNECGDLPESYSFYLARGNFRDQNNANGESDYLKALKYGEDNWRPYHILHNYYVSNNQYDKALNISQRAIKIFGDSYMIKYDHAMSLLYNEKYDECVELLQKTVILPHEGAGYGRMAWKNANLLNALKYYSANKIKKALFYAANAYKWPENLGVGRPFIVDERAENYITSMILEKLGRKKESMELLKKIENYNEGKPDDGRSINYLSVLALNKLNQGDEATKYFNRWIDLCKNNRTAEWAKLMFENNKVQAADLIRSVSAEGKNPPWIPEGTDSDFRIINEIARIN